MYVCVFQKMNLNMKFESRTINVCSFSLDYYTFDFSLNDMRLIDETERHTELMISSMYM